MAGHQAVDAYVQSDTVVGFGSGVMVRHALVRLGRKLVTGELKDVRAVTTCEQTQELAESLGIPVATVHMRSKLDVFIAEADEVDQRLNLVKGNDGDMLREKMAGKSADKLVVIVEDNKLCSKGLGPGNPVAVEIVPFCHRHTMRQIAVLPALKGCRTVLRVGEVLNSKADADLPAVTKNGNYIVDLYFKQPISDLIAAAEQLKATVGVVEHGLFVGMTAACLVAGTEQGKERARKICQVAQHTTS